MGASVSAPGQHAEASSTAQQDTEESIEGITSSNSKKKSTLILRSILKEASVQSPLASAPSYGVFDHYRGSKELRKLFYQIYKSKDGLLEKIRAQDWFAVPKRERGVICWRERVERPDGDGKGSVKFAWLSSNARTGFRLSPEWILYIESVNPSKTTPASGFSSPGAFVEIRQHLHAEDDENPGIYGTKSTNPGEMSVRINDVAIEINVRVEPLPSFAVIEMNGSAVFWWRTKEALDFVPKKTRPTRSFVDSQGYENLGVALPAVKRQKISSNRAKDTAPDAATATTTAAPFNTAALSLTAAPRNTTAPSNAAAPPNSSIADNTDTAINPGPSEAGTKNAEKELKNPRIKAPHIGKTAGLNEPSSALPRPSWKAKLELGLRRHQESQKHAVVPQILEQVPHPEFDERMMRKSPLDYSRDLLDEEVVKGIATLWTALQNRGKHFAFGSTDTFAWNRMGSFPVIEPAVKGPKYPFIIPLIFDFGSDNTDHGNPKSGSDPGKGKGKDKPPPPPGIGHHILAVARVTDGPIIVTILDTSPTFLKQARIEKTVTDVVTRSGWLGKDTSGTSPLPVWPTFEFQYPKVPQQEGVNECGVYVILNAWATMLGLEITPHKTRRVLPRGETSKIPFLRTLKKIIDLAIAGHMDTETILAFLVSYGYILEPRDPDSIPRVQLDQNFNQNLVAQALYEARQQEKLELAQQATQEQEEEYIAEDDVQYVMDKTGCTHTWAKRAVENARGFRNIAPFFVPPERRASDLEKLRDENNSAAVVVVVPAGK